MTIDALNYTINKLLMTSNKDTALFTPIQYLFFLVSNILCVNFKRLRFYKKLM